MVLSRYLSIYIPGKPRVRTKVEVKVKICACIRIKVQEMVGVKIIVPLLLIKALLVLLQIWGLVI